MKFTVTHTGTSWVFEVEATEYGESYYEQFELTDLNEARDTAWDLIEEIVEEQDDPIATLFDEEE